MHYNKEVVNNMLDEGVYNSADVIEDLFEFINEVFRCKTITDMACLKQEWEKDN